MTLKKVYVDRQPKVGDWIEVTSNPFNAWYTRVGYEYQIVYLADGFVGVRGDRIPSFKDEITVHDGHYRVFEYQDMPEPKETHVKIYKLLGIPIGKRTTYIY